MGHFEKRFVNPSRPRQSLEPTTQRGDRNAQTPGCFGDCVVWNLPQILHESTLWKHRLVASPLLHEPKDGVRKNKTPFQQERGGLFRIMQNNYFFAAFHFAQRAFCAAAILAFAAALIFRLPFLGAFTAGLPLPTA